MSLTNLLSKSDRLDDRGRPIEYVTDRLETGAKTVGGLSTRLRRTATERAADAVDRARDELDDRTIDEFDTVDELRDRTADETVAELRDRTVGRAANGLRERVVARAEDELQRSLERTLDDLRERTGLARTSDSTARSRPSCDATTWTGRDWTNGRSRRSEIGSRSRRRPTRTSTTSSSDSSASSLQQNRRPERIEASRRDPKPNPRPIARSRTSPNSFTRTWISRRTDRSRTPSRNSSSETP